MRIPNRKQNGTLYLIYRDAEKEQMGMKVSDLNDKLEKSEKECEKMRK